MQKDNLDLLQWINRANFKNGSNTINENEAGEVFYLQFKLAEI